MTDIISTEYINTNQTFTVNVPNDFTYDLSSAGFLQINAAVSIQDSLTSDTLVGVHTKGTGSPQLLIGSAGSLTVNALNSADNAYGFRSDGIAAYVQNDGIFSVSATGDAIGVALLDGGAFLNNRNLTVTSSGLFTNASAVVVGGTGLTIIVNHGTITAQHDNSGTITAGYAIDAKLQPGPVLIGNTGTMNGNIALGTSAGNELDNTGAIHGDVTFYGLSGQQLYDGRGGGTVTGVITFSNAATGGADYAYLGNDGETVHGGAASLNALGGTGADHITGGAGDDLIDGGAGNDVLDGGAGNNSALYYSATAGVTVSLLLQDQAQNTGGAGTDTLSNFKNLGGSKYDDHLTGDDNDNLIDTGGGGNDVIDGRGGFNSVGFSLATHGVTVSLALQGQTQNTGAGADFLTSFQGLIGSSYGDTLEGGGAAATFLTGGLGADTFVWRPGDGQVEVMDFSHAQGDRINLSHLLHSWDEIQAAASQVGSNTVIATSSDELILYNVQLSSLTAADFILSRPTGDFLGTGRGGLFWQNAVNNLTSVWTVGDDGHTSGLSLPAISGWQTLDTGNFSGGPYSGDFLLRNTTTGMVDIWQDNGGVMSGQDVDRATLDWNIMGTADFNGDGKSDILWRNEVNGYVSVWQMDGAHVSTTYNPGVVGLEWKIVGAGDFVGDGKAEVLWRNVATGEVDLWTIDGPGAGQTHGEKIADLPLNWKVAGSGDFNGDGKNDILWQDQVSGQMVVWQMNGAQVMASQDIGNPGPQWKVVALSDVNGDGKADILWRDSGTGQVVTWEMDGFNVIANPVLATVDNTWQTINHHYDWA